MYLFPNFWSQYRTNRRGQGRWGQKYADTSLFSGGMKFSDEGKVVEDKMINAVLEQERFLAVFTGKATTSRLLLDARHYGGGGPWSPYLVPILQYRYDTQAHAASGGSRHFVISPERQLLLEQCDDTALTLFNHDYYRRHFHNGRSRQPIRAELPHRAERDNGQADGCCRSTVRGNQCRHGQHEGGAV